MNHKKLVLMGIWIGLIVSLSVMGRELPLQQVSHPECKGVHRQQLSDDCKIVLDAPKEQSMSELLISVLWGASYDDNHTPGAGSHPSTDFVSTIGTPVYTIGDGEVVTAKYRSGYGNAITIRHDFDGQTIFSNYSHLSVMNVRPGQRVEQGMKIGEVGRSGFTIGPYGYHLDFQITTADSPSHPYGFHDCKEGGYMKVVQEGLCKDKLEAYTIDPLDFFAKFAGSELRPVGRVSPAAETVSDLTDEVVRVQNDEVEEYLDVEPEAPSILVPRVEQSTQPLEDTVVIVKPSGPEESTRSQIHGSAVDGDKTAPVVAMKPGFDVSRERLGESSAVGQIIPIRFTITQDDELVSGRLDDRISVSADESVETLPGGFSRVFRGKKTIFLRPQESGIHRIDVRSGDLQLGQIVLDVQ